MKEHQSVVLVADNSLHETFIDLDIDVSIFDVINEKFDSVVITNITADNLAEKIRKKIKIDQRKRIVWNTRIKMDSEEYFKLLSKINPEVSLSLSYISEDAKRLRKILKKLDQGTSFEDAYLFASAKYIQKYINVQPIIVANDRDLLTSGNLLSSFFSLSIGFFSCFELLQFIESDQNLSTYCKKHKVSAGLEKIYDKWPKKDLEKELSKLLRLGQLSCHPSPQGRGSIPLRLIKR